MRRHGVEVEVLGAIDHDIATGVYPRMTEHGWETDEWPQIWERVKAANSLVLLYSMEHLGMSSRRRLTQADAG